MGYDVVKPDEILEIRSMVRRLDASLTKILEIMEGNNMQEINLQTVMAVNNAAALSHWAGKALIEVRRQVESKRLQGMADNALRPPKVAAAKKTAKGKKK